MSVREAGTRPQLREWVAACALAETIGMTAAAGAARWADQVGGGIAGLGLVVLGGLVEGLALGSAQGVVLARAWPNLDRARFLAVTLVVAALGWAAGAAPGTLSAGDAAPGEAAEPPLLLVLAGAAGIGLLMGPLLGSAQAWALRGVVERPGRWVVANTAAWPPVMVLIFLGATRPEASWSTAAVLGLGAVTGALAGTVLGLVTGRWLGALGPLTAEGRRVRSRSSGVHARSGPNSSS